MSCYHSIVIQAPARRVWDGIKDFHNASWANNVVSSCEVVGKKKGTEIGAQRILNGAFHETLQAIDNISQTFRYSIDDGPGAVSKDQVSGYIGQVCVHSVSNDDSCFIVWSSAWQSSVGDVGALCNPIYVALLADMKHHFESTV